MADPISVIASLVGVSTACAQIADSVLKFCERLRHASRDIRNIGSNMLLLSTVLDSVRRTLQRGGDLYTPLLLKQTKSIDKRLRRVIKDVEQVINPKPSLLGHTNWAMFGHAKTGELSRKIEALKSALTLVLLTIQLAVAQDVQEDRVP
jgi:hypothetical protein